MRDDNKKMMKQIKKNPSRQQRDPRFPAPAGQRQASGTRIPTSPARLLPVRAERAHSFQPLDLSRCAQQEGTGSSSTMTPKGIEWVKKIDGK